MKKDFARCCSLIEVKLPVHFPRIQGLTCSKHMQVVLWARPIIQVPVCPTLHGSLYQGRIYLFNELSQCEVVSVLVQIPADNQGSSSSKLKHEFNNAR